MEVHRQFLESRPDATELFEPADALLGDAPAAVGFAVKFRRRVMPSLFVGLMWDHRLDFLFGQPVTDPLYAVALVGGKLLRFMPALSLLASCSDQARNRLPDHRLGHGRFVHLAGCYFGGKRSSRTVSDHVEFRSKPASRASQCVVRRFVGVQSETFLSAPAAAREARTLAPSTHHNSQSIRPCLSSLTCNVSMIAANTPARRQLEKYRCTVLQEPKRSGRSRHGAPVPRIQKMPLSIRRGSFAGRPVSAVLRGTRGEISSHCSSVSSCRFISADLHVVMEGYRQSSLF